MVVVSTGAGVAEGTVVVGEGKLPSLSLFFSA